MDCLASITLLFSSGANLSGSEVTKVSVRNGMNGEFTRINCKKLRTEFTKERNAYLSGELTSSLHKPPTLLTSIRGINLVQINNTE